MKENCEKFMSHKPESVLRQQILKVLTKAGWLCIPYHGGIYGSRGIPDFLCCVPPRGLFLGVEVKTSTGVISPIQRATHRLIASKGGAFAVVRSVAEAKELVERLDKP